LREKSLPPFLRDAERQASAIELELTDLSLSLLDGEKKGNNPVLATWDIRSENLRRRKPVLATDPPSFRGKLRKKWGEKGSRRLVLR
jgi:hypothetical protein